MAKSFLLLLAAAMSVFAGSEMDLQSTVAKHLTTSRDFTLKVAEAMPASDYDFKLTPAQMSFGEQMTHLAQGLGYFLSAFSGEKPDEAKPKSKNKEDIIAFTKMSFDDAIGKVSKLSREQLMKTHKTSEGSTSTGTDLLLGMLDHTTHHRASAEMYLRAKGIKPPEYQF